MNTKRLCILWLCVFIFFSHTIQAQILVETFDATAWSTDATNSNSGNVTRTMASSATVTYTSYSANAASASSTFSIDGPSTSAIYVWNYSKASVFSGNTSSSRRHSHIASWAMASSSSFLITPVIANGISTVSFYAATSSAASSNFSIGINTNTTIATPTTGSTSGGTNFLLYTSAYSISNVNGLSKFDYTYTGTYTGGVRVAFYNTTGQTCYIDDIIITAAAILPPNPSSPSVAQSGCSTTQMNITWSAPLGYNAGSNTILAFLKQGSAVTVGSPNATLATYTANTTFSSGTAYQNDASAYCIYKGDGSDGAGNQSGLTVTGLTAGATYYLLLFNVSDL